MVGREIQEMFPRTRRERGEVVLEVEATPRSAGSPLRDLRPPSRGGARDCGAPRSGPHRNGARDFRARPGARGKDPRGSVRRPGGGAGAAPPGRGTSERGPKARGARRDANHRREPYAHAPRRSRALWAWSYPGKTRGRGEELDRHSGHPVPRARASRSSELSGGNQQKVALARLLYHDLDVLLLDEPTRGIDVGSKASLYRLIDDLASRGKAILLVSSYLPELLWIVGPHCGHAPG